MNKFVTILAFFSMLSMAYAMDNQERNEDQDPTTVAIRRGPNANQKKIVVTPEEVSRKFSALPKKRLGGSILHSIGLGEASKEYIELSAATVMVTRFMTEKFEGVGRELSETQSNLSRTATDMNQTSEQMRGAAEIFSQSAATEKALKEEQERTNQLRQELSRLKFQQQALELALDVEKEKTHGLLTAKNTAERDLLIAQKRCETLESLKEEKERIIQQLQHVQQEKAELEKQKNLFENLLKRKLELDRPLGEINPTEMEKLIEAQEAQAKEELKKLRDLIEEEKIKEVTLQQQIKRLEEEKIKNEKRITELSKSIHLSENPYEHLKILIELPAAEFSDKNLACEFMLIMTRTGKNLDELTPEGKKRLIEILLDRTRPYQSRYDEYNNRRRNERDKITPGGENDYAYRGCDRELGNAFIPGGGFGLNGYGNPLNVSSCGYKGSQFERNANIFLSGINK